MKTERNILLAFILNAVFSVFELFGGIFTGSIAIISDAMHDFGDAAAIGISYFLEKKSKRQGDEKYTYGYGRYSLLGGVITTLILLIGSAVIIFHAAARFFRPAEINYNGMIAFAVVGVCVNLCAAFFTRGKGSLNQKAVNLHMLEDVFGWAIVLIGAFVMKYTGWVYIDPIMSIIAAVFILVNAVRNLAEAMPVFLERTPVDIETGEIEAHLMEIEGVIGVHHIHIWSVDEHNACATMHVVSNADQREIKEKIRSELREHGITHATLEFEREGEACAEMHCRMEKHTHAGHCCHHHH